MSVCGQWFMIIASRIDTLSVLLCPHQLLQLELPW